LKKLTYNVTILTGFEELKHTKQRRQESIKEKKRWRNRFWCFSQGV